MNCDEVNKLLADYLYHELDADKMAEFEAHLRSCDKCSAEVASHSTTPDGIVLLSPGFWRAAYKALLHARASRTYASEFSSTILQNDVVCSSAAS